MKKIFAQFANDKILAAALILVNLAGVAFGFYYYYQQFVATPVHLWLFIPDSPTAVFLFASFLFLYSFQKKQYPWLNLLTSVALVKTGVWSIFVLLFFWPSFFSLNPVFSSILIVLHLGMVFEAVVVWSVWKKSVEKEHAALVLGWFLLGDFVDYVIGTVPYPIPFIGSPYLTMLAVESFAATLLLWTFLRKRA